LAALLCFPIRTASPVDQQPHRAGHRQNEDAGTHRTRVQVLAGNGIRPALSRNLGTLNPPTLDKPFVPAFSQIHQPPMLRKRRKLCIDFRFKRHIVISENSMSRMAIFFLVVCALGLALVIGWLGWMTVQTNLVGWFLLLVGSAYLVGVIVVYWYRKERFWGPRAGGTILKEEDNDSSFWWIVIGMIAAFFLPPIEYLFLPTILPRITWMEVAGLIIIFLGSVLFIWARRTLGNFYSGHVSVVEGQPLVRSGPYHFIRHPAYAGYLLIAFGIALGFSSLLGFIVILLLLLPSVIYRLSVEDKLLAKHFGEQFGIYADKTARLIPGIW
jgi:protein-S-isoprenylcysteine O-methyltransferase Ste14